MFFQNTGIFLQVHTLLLPRRTASTLSQLWKAQISFCQYLSLDIMCIV
jgi:hypothetical protein